MAIVRAGLGVLMLAASAMATTPPDATPTPPAAQAPSAVGPTEGDWSVLRVGGDMAAQVRWDEDRGWLYDVMRVETPLPVGYPQPTPPGAIELKRYPSVRRAEITSRLGEMSGSGGFWPLFRHIQRHNIEMTAPVEMDYAGLAEDGAKAGRVTASTMSFLYRTPELRDTGTDPRDSRVIIRDTEPVTVVALGVRGIGVDAGSTRPHFATLEAWLRDNPQWVKAGEYRVFGYNGPDTRRSRRWVEVQIPVKPAASAPAEAPAAESPAAANPPAANPPATPAPRAAR